MCLLICRADIFSYSISAVYGADLSFSSNEFISLMTCQMLFSRAVLFVTRDPSKLFGVSK